jgi:cyclase
LGNYTNDSTKIIPGHGPISYKKDLVSYRDMLVIVVNRVKTGIENKLTIEQIKEQNPLKSLNLASNYYFNLPMIYGMVKAKMEKSE